jgi:anaerobic selenocysteine-containing dehydrogenase
VAIDVELSASAKFAHYVIAPTLSLERADVTLLADGWYESPYSHYTDAIVDAPPECIDEWEFYWELSHRMGTPIALSGGELDLENRPTKHEVLERIIPRPRIPLAQLRAHDGGRVYDEIDVDVEPGDPTRSEKMLVTPEGIVDELREVRAERFSNGGGYGEECDGFTHRLISRRLRHVFNSSGQTLSALRAKGTTNPAFMHPDDLTGLGLRNGDVIEIRSAHSAILGVATAADDVRNGVISMAHAWGDPAADPKEVRDVGSSTNALVDDETDYCPISGMARQSGIPVNVTRTELA